MEIKYFDKDTLSALNGKAIEASGRAIREEIVAALNPFLRYPVRPALQQEKGWVRCWVILGPDEGQIALLDIRDKDLDSLPSKQVAFA